MKTVFSTNIKLKVETEKRNSNSVLTGKKVENRKFVARVCCETISCNMTRVGEHSVDYFADMLFRCIPRWNCFSRTRQILLTVINYSSSRRWTESKSSVFVRFAFTINNLLWFAQQSHAYYAYICHAPVTQTVPKSKSYSIWFYYGNIIYRSNEQATSIIKSRWEVRHKIVWWNRNRLWVHVIRTTSYGCIRARNTLLEQNSFLASPSGADDVRATRSSNEYFLVSDTFPVLERREFLLFFSPTNVQTNFSSFLAKRMYKRPSNRDRNGNKKKIIDIYIVHDTCETRVYNRILLRNA